MKLLDRYVLVSFLRNYLIAFMVLVGIYVVLDMVVNFDELVEFRSAAGDAGTDSVFGVLFRVADYYFHQGFLFFTHLSGIIPIVAAAFTLVRLTRFNELTAALAAGVDLRRVAMPIILAAAVINGVLLINQEVLIPRMIPKLTRSHDDLRKSTLGYPVQAMQDSGDRLFNAAKYTPATDTSPARIVQLDVIEHGDDLKQVTHLIADAAVWDESGSRWVLENGRKTLVVGPDGNRGEPVPETEYRGQATPDEIAMYRSGDYVELLSTARINQLLERPDRYGAENLMRVKHWRFTQPIVNLILILLAVPCVLCRDASQLKKGISLCLLLVSLCMASVFLFGQFGATPGLPPFWQDRWPALMAWMPIFIWGPVAVWLMDRLPT